MAGAVIPFDCGNSQPVEALDILVAQDDAPFSQDLLYLTRLLRAAQPPMAYLQALQRVIALLALTHAQRYDPDIAVPGDAIRGAYDWMTYKGHRIPAPSDAVLRGLLLSLEQEGSDSTGFSGKIPSH
jgi:hypothetical protein